MSKRPRSRVIAAVGERSSAVPVSSISKLMWKDDWQPVVIALQNMQAALSAVEQQVAQRMALTDGVDVATYSLNLTTWQWERRVS